MKLDKLNNEYFVRGTRGYTILSKYYYKYRDLFEKTLFSEIKDFVNQVFLNVTKIDFSKEIKNVEAYIIGTIKIQCRVQLDKALKMKNTIPESRLKNLTDDEDSLISLLPAIENNPIELIDLQEILTQINLFKLMLKQKEIQLLNCLIDEKSRKEIADEMQLNFNTLDTYIRRLRMKMVSFFRNLGYSLDIFDRYEK